MSISRSSQHWKPATIWSHFHVACFRPQKRSPSAMGFQQSKHFGFQQPLRSMCPPIFKGELWTANWNCPPIAPKICMRGWFTPTKTNMPPKKEPFHKEGALPTTIFQGTCWFSGGESLSETWETSNIRSPWKLKDKVDPCCRTVSTLKLR